MSSLLVLQILTELCARIPYGWENHPQSSPILPLLLTSQPSSHCQSLGTCVSVCGMFAALTEGYTFRDFKFKHDESFFVSLLVCFVLSPVLLAVLIWKFLSPLCQKASVYRDKSLT